MSSITPERWEQVQDLVMSALQVNDEKRKTLLDEACADDTELREAVETLLDVRDADKSFLLDKPPPTSTSHLTGTETGSPAPLHEFGQGDRISHFEVEAVLGVLWPLEKILRGWHSSWSERSPPSGYARRENWRVLFGLSRKHGFLKRMA